MSGIGSTIVTVAMLLTCLVWLLLFRPSLKVSIAVLVAFVVVFQFFSPWFMQFLSSVAGASGGMTADLATDLGTQVTSYEYEGGSLWTRMTMYQDLLVLIANNPLGLGPGGLQQHFIANPSVTGLADPHNWWLEIAANYGIPAAIAFAALFMSTAVLLFKEFRRSCFAPCGIVLGLLSIPLIGSLAPSSFDYNTLAWLPFVLGVGLLVNRSRDKVPE